MTITKSVLQLLIPVVAITVTAPVAARASADAQPADAPDQEIGWRVSLETDPFDYFFNGYAVLVGVRAPVLPQWRFSLATFGLDLPDFLVTLDSANEGFGVRIVNGTGAQANYHFSETGSSWFAGAAIATFKFRYEHDEVPGERADVRSLAVGVQGGYQWFPIDDVGFYLLPWSNASVAVAQSGDAVVGMYEFSAPPVNVNLLLHAGYEF